MSTIYDFLGMFIFFGIFFTLVGGAVAYRVFVALRAARLRETFYRERLAHYRRAVDEAAQPS